MNITELIERAKAADRDSVQRANGSRIFGELAEALLAQQVCIEQMREALKKTRSFLGDAAGFSPYGSENDLAEFLQRVKREELEAVAGADKALAIQPNLSALREHDASVLATFFEHFAEGKYLEIEADEFQRYIERIRKGEAA